jgi:hypothetical protein
LSKQIDGNSSGRPGYSLVTPDWLIARVEAGLRRMLALALR